MPSIARATTTTANYSAKLEHHTPAGVLFFGSRYTTTDKAKMWVTTTTGTDSEDKLLVAAIAPLT